MTCVLCRKYDILCRNLPVDPKVRVIPCYGTFRLRSIEIVTFVLEDDLVSQNHESVGKAVEGCADMLICVGEEAKYIALAAEKIMNKEDIYVYPSADYEKAAKLVAETAKEGDTVLFKASNRTNLRKVMEITAL